MLVRAVLPWILCGLAACEPRPAPIVIEFPPQREKKVGSGDAATRPPSSLNTVLAQRRVIVQVTAYDRDSPRLAMALDMLRDAEAAVPVKRVWRANGILLASIERARMPMLLANLPRPLEGKVYTLYNALVDNPITLIQGINGRQLVEVVEADGSLHPRRFFGGEYRILLKIIPPQSPGPASLALLPQQFSRSRALLARSPQDRSQEGSSFDQLHISEVLGEEVWVITADPRAQPKADPSGPGPQPRSGGSTVTLGQAMLTGDYRGAPVRLLVVIGLEQPTPTP